MNTVLISIASMAGLGFFFASVLAFVNQKLKVKEDPLVEKLIEALPGLNCNACGFATCRRYAEALAKGHALPDRCKVGGEEVRNFLSRILGVKIEERGKETAIVHCGADVSKRKKKANYLGMKTCLAAHTTFGGEVLCEYGCLGYGDCVKACPFEAIAMINGLPVVEGGRCTACGKCTAACPRGLISVEKIDSENFIYVSCSNRASGAETRKICAVGCTGCGICRKLTNGVFSVENNLARVQYNRMKDIVNSEEVMSKCPTRCIVNERHLRGGRAEGGDSSEVE